MIVLVGVALVLSAMPAQAGEGRFDWAGHFPRIAFAKFLVVERVGEDLKDYAFVWVAVRTSPDILGLDAVFSPEVQLISCKVTCESVSGISDVNLQIGLLGQLDLSLTSAEMGPVTVHWDDGIWVSPQWTESGTSSAAFYGWSVHRAFTLVAALPHAELWEDDHTVTATVGQMRTKFGGSGFVAKDVSGQFTLTYYDA